MAVLPDSWFWAFWCRSGVETKKWSLLVKNQYRNGHSRPGLDLCFGIKVTVSLGFSEKKASELPRTFLEQKRPAAT